MKIDPRHLEILAAIVDRGGLMEGAAHLGKSQPSVSRSLAMLEARLGITLFEPNRRPLRPTEFCLALAQEGRRILESGQQASTLIQQFKAGRTGAIRLAGTPVFIDGVVTSMIADFQSENPNIRIDQSYGYPAEIIDRLSNGTLDIGVMPIRASEVPPGFAFTQILTGRNVIACRTGHPLTRATSLRLSQIAAFPWIAPPIESPLYHDLRAVLSAIGMQDFKISFSGGSLSAITNVLVGSDALTVLPYSVVFNLRRQNSLAALSVRIGDPDRHLGIMMPGELPSRPVVNRLARFLESEFATFRNLMQRHEQNMVWRS